MKTRCIMAICLAALLTFKYSAVAQHQHQPSSEKLVDGSVHPELITDTTAYRLFLATYAGTDQQHRKLQGALFRKIGLSQDDQLVMRNTVDDFGVRFQHILDEDAKETAAKPGTDHTTFVVSRDFVMDEILRSLKVQLSKIGFEHLSSYVQSEKRNMRVSPELERRRQ